MQKLTLREIKKKKKKLNKQKTFLFHPPTTALLSNTIICPKEIK